MSNPYTPRSYVGHGVETAFPTGWRFLAAADLVVEKSIDNGVTWTTLVLGADYTVAGAAADEPGGGVTLTTPLPFGDLLSITRETATVQPLVLAQSGNIPVKTLTAQLDRVILALQELVYRVGALESLQSLLVVTATANAAAVDVVFAGADPVESAFPIVVAVANGQNARGVLMRVVDDGADLDLAKRAPALNWRPGPAANQITLLCVSDLEAGNGYEFQLLVLF